MILLDANILIYAYHPQMPEHQRSRDWLEAQLAGSEPIGLAWVTIWAFVRISSNPQIWRAPTSLDQLFDRVEEWLDQPNVVIVGPGTRYGHIYRAISVNFNAIGKLASDAALAAIAIEHAATLASTDRDFRRFSGLRWIHPLD